MDESTLNNSLNNFVRQNLSPLEKERDLIDSRYKELKDTLSGHTFRSGSFARYTAIHPVHDLDVINEYTELQFEDIPRVMTELAALLSKHYGDRATVTQQSHSVTVVFPDKFSIDVVPGLVLSSESNEYGEPLYLVPDIQKMSHASRSAKYEAGNRVDSKKSDPKGYRKHAQDLNKINSDFRHSVKLIKGWRHGCRELLGEKFVLKAFHSELILTQYFTDNPQAKTYDAVKFFFDNLPGFLAQAQIPDRADPNVMVDEYVNELTAAEKETLHSEIELATGQINQIADKQTEAEVHQILSEVCRINKQKVSNSGPSGYVRPTGAWAE